MRIFDNTVLNILTSQLKDIEKAFDSDVISYYGVIHPYIEKPFRDFIEQLAVQAGKKEKLTIILTTTGGSVETVEKLVTMVRHFYPKEVCFVIPDYAMSAGTIFSMSGDKIFMDYSSSLGPIDPQVYNGKNWVPALGYLDKINEIIGKTTLTPADIVFVQNQDLAMLSRFEQAKNLTITLLKKWLVDYKFKNWDVHESTGKPVTQTEKESRAEEIAIALGDNKQWHSHSRMIGIRELSTHPLRLKIDDYTADSTIRPLIRTYNDLMSEYLLKNDIEFFIHSRVYPKE